MSWELKMIDATNFALFMAASWALILAPGPDTLYVITRGVSQGRKAGLLSALGVTLGILVHTVFAAFGLAMILQTSAMAFLMVKYIGAGYLVFLGIKALRNKSSFSLLAQAEEMDSRTVLWQGMLSNVLNPKIALFFLAFLPQFVDQSSRYISVQMVVLGLTFAGCGVIFLSVVGYFAGGIGHWLSHKPQIANKLRWLTGIILVGLGLRLAFVQRQ
jgi:threonine/homoserine/homoserine lactone efflux protein